MRALTRLVCVCLAFTSRGGFQPPVDLPLVFVPEFCSDSSSLATLFTQLPRRRVGNELVTLFLDESGTVRTRRGPADGLSFAIDFFDPVRCRRARLIRSAALDVFGPQY